MRIFRLEFDPAYRSLEVADQSLLTTPLFQFDSTSRGDDWEPIELISLEETKPVPDFFRLKGLPQLFVASQTVVNQFTMLEEFCEQLSVFYKGVELYLHSIDERGCFDTLDVENCIWPAGQIGSRAPFKYAFLTRFSTPVFTVLETCEIETYVAEYEGDPAEEFKARIEDRNLTGLQFQELWSDME